MREQVNGESRISGGAGVHRALSPAIKIRQAPDDYVYADAVVTCDPHDDVPGQDWIDYSTLVVAVLSPCTERYGRSGKVEGYKNIPTFREYVLVESRRRRLPRSDIPLSAPSQLAT